MTNVKFIDAQEADFEHFEVKDAPVTSARTATEALIDALNEASESSTVSIHRQRGSGKENLTFLESFAPDKFDSESLLMYIRNTYGGGDFRIHVRAGGKIRANRGVSIELPKNVSRETNGSGSGEIKEVLSMMQLQAQQHRQDMQALMTQLQGGNSKKDFLEEMLVYKQLFGGGESKPQGFTEILKTVEGLKTLGINIGGIATEHNDESFGKILENATPILTALLNRPPQQSQQQKQSSSYKQNPQQRQKEGVNSVNLQAQMGIATLVKAAEKKADTGFYADVVLDNVDAETLLGIFNSPDVEGDLFKINQKTRDHVEWFRDLGEHIKGALGLPSIYSDQYSDLTDAPEVDIKEVVHHQV